MKIPHWLASVMLFPTSLWPHFDKQQLWYPYKLFENYNPYNVSRMNQISPLLNSKVQASWSVMRKNQITVTFFIFTLEKVTARLGIESGSPCMGIYYHIYCSTVIWCDVKKKSYINSTIFPFLNIVLYKKLDCFATTQ